jgi:predicted transposase/invertase (TIGR01784 family)
MSLAERLKAEGKIEGRIEGRIEGKIEGKIESKIETAERLLAEKIDLVVIARVTGLPLTKIEEIQKKH